LKRKEGWVSLKEQAEASGANLSPEELNIIRKQVDKNHQKEIDKERQRLGLKIDRIEDELLKEKFPEENNSEEEEENKEE
ncbi:17163_t:CDS:2, partial [Racocetra persica]